MRITKIERQKKHPTRKSVFIDGRFAFGVSDEVLLTSSLHEGVELEEADLQKILRREDEESAKQKSLRFLSIRPRSVKEMRDYLRRKEYAEEIAASVIAELKTLKLLDDVSFARMVCRDTLAKKPAGEKLLRSILFKKGVQKTDIDAILPEFFTSASELEMALQAAERQQMRAKRSSKFVDDLHAEKKLLDYLVRRGFTFETALNATKQILSK